MRILKAQWAWWMVTLCSCSTLAGLDGIDYPLGKAGAKCVVASDCLSGVCSDGRCQTATTDGGADSGAGGSGVCSALNPWSPASITIQVDGLAATLNLTIHGTGVGSALNASICKQGGDFINDDIYVVIDDTSKHPAGLALYDGDLATNGSKCTNNGSLSDTSDWAEGEKLGGPVTIVSPAYCYPSWGRDCALGGNNCGYCWAKTMPPMTRTCF